MITAGDVVPLILDACPSFVAVWEIEIEQDPIHLNEDGTRLDYLDASAFSRHLVRLLKAHRSDEITASFQAIEKLLVDGDPYVKELATIGYLESLQNHAGWDEKIEASDFEGFLQPESRRWWKGLIRFWSGDSPAVRPVDD